MIEHIQEENQQGATTPLLEVLDLQMNAKIEGHLGKEIEGLVEISTIQDEHIKP